MANKSNFGALTNKKKSSSNLGPQGIWPFNPKAMDSKTQPSQIYTIESVSD